jgi:undecaprenyl-diphosphatase
VNSEFILKWDTYFFRLGNHSGISPFLDQLMLLTSNAFVWTLSIIGLWCFHFAKKQLDQATTLIVAGLALGLTDIISFEIVKPWVARDRPCWMLDHVHTIANHCGGSYGFTSNHAANGAALLVILFLSSAFTKTIKYTALFSVIMVGYSRVYLGVHFPGDILGGYFLGGCIALALNRLTALKSLVQRLLKHIVRGN